MKNPHRILLGSVLIAGLLMQAGPASGQTPPTGPPAASHWASVPGRTYQIELTAPLTGQWARTGWPVVANGLSTTQTLVFPTTRKAALMRVSHLLP